MCAPANPRSFVLRHRAEGASNAGGRCAGRPICSPRERRGRISRWTDRCWWRCADDPDAHFALRPAAASRGALLFGHIEFGVTLSLIIGSVPAVLIGSVLSSRAPDRYIRPSITFVIFASGLKYVGVGTTTLGWILCATLLVTAVSWFASVKPWRSSELPSVHDATYDAPVSSEIPTDERLTHPFE